MCKYLDITMWYLFIVFYSPSKNAGFFRGVHSKCIPGTDKEVIIIVMHRRRKTVPERAKNRRNSMKRCLWKTRTVSHTKHKTVPVNSHIWNAHGIYGTLSRNMSGNGGYFFISGTRSCTITMTNAVIQVTVKR